MFVWFLSAVYWNTTFRLKAHSSVLHRKTQHYKFMQSMWDKVNCYRSIPDKGLKWWGRLYSIVKPSSCCGVLRMYSYPSRVPPPLSRAVVPSKRPRVSLSVGGNRQTKTNFSTSSKSSPRTSRTSTAVTHCYLTIIGFMQQKSCLLQV